MSNSFAPFYDTAAEILKSNGDGFSSSRTIFRTIKADIQFSSTHIGEYGFGFKYEKSAKLYCTNEDTEGVNEGDFVRIRGITYRIEHIENRSMGALLILKSTSDERTAI